MSFRISLYFTHLIHNTTDIDEIPVLAYHVVPMKCTNENCWIAKVWYQISHLENHLIDSNFVSINSFGCGLAN